MQLSTLALVLAAGLPALARPALDTRQTTDPCAGLGDGALSSLSGSITLAALNTNLPNDNSTGVPLTLGLSIASSHDQQWSIQTLASAGGFYTKYQDVTLANGGLVAVVESRLVGKQPVTSGQVAFLWNGNPGPAAPIYCATPPVQEGGLRQLALNGRTDAFTLCPTLSQGRNTNDIFFDVTRAECTPVTVQIVEASV